MKNLLESLKPEHKATIEQHDYKSLANQVFRDLQNNNSILDLKFETIIHLGMLLNIYPILFTEIDNLFNYETN